jgi:Arc-like DNA binding domain
MPKSTSPRARREMMPGVNVRMPREFIDWLLDRAAEDGSSLSTEVRNCVAAAIVKAGDAKRYGIDVEELGE